MAERPEELVEGSEQVVAAFGMWPGFHDADLLSVEREEDRCRVAIHHRFWESDGHGGSVPVNNHLVHLELRGVTECTISAGYDSDVLFELDVQRAGDARTVVFDSAMGPEKDWLARCADVRVTAVVPCDREGRPLA